MNKFGKDDFAEVESPSKKRRIRSQKDIHTSIVPGAYILEKQAILMETFIVCKMEKMSSIDHTTTFDEVDTLMQIDHIWGHV